jgi:hypothetical protein
MPLRAASQSNRKAYPYFLAAAFKSSNGPFSSNKSLGKVVFYFAKAK